MGTGTYAIALTNEQADAMRSLAAELRADHMDGLAQRAHSVGYSRESMHLQEMPDGQILLLVHLEYEGDDHDAVHSRLATFPENDFTRWWNPRFLAITNPPESPRPSVLPPVESLFSLALD